MRHRLWTRFLTITVGLVILSIGASAQNEIVEPLHESIKPDLKILALIDDVAKPAVHAKNRHTMGYTTRTVASAEGKESKRLAPQCQSFIRKNGSYGKIGKQLANWMKKDEYKKAFLKKGSLTPYCPAFDKLKREEKIHAWVWFWMVLANEESDCASEKLHPTHIKIKGHWVRINPKYGYGMFAAELYGGDRHWRGPMCRGNIRTAKLQVSCAIETMYNTQLENGETARDPASYWGPVRRDEQQILPGMSLYAPCFGGENGRK